MYVSPSNTSYTYHYWYHLLSISHKINTMSLVLCSFSYAQVCLLTHSAQYMCIFSKRVQEPNASYPGHRLLHADNQLLQLKRKQVYVGTN